MKKFALAGVGILLLSVSIGIAQRAGDSSDLAVVHRIRQEALTKSQVMKHLFYLTDVHGPRLTNSPGFDAAADWVVEQSKKWGLENAAKEKWGPFGRGWSASSFSAHLREPQYATLIGVPLTWTPGTNGVISGTPIFAPLRPDQDFDRYKANVEAYMTEHKGKLRGQIVLFRERPEVKVQETAAMRRLSANELSERAAAPEPVYPIAIDFRNPVVPTDPDERRRNETHSRQHGEAAAHVGRYSERRDPFLLSDSAQVTGSGVRCHQEVARNPLAAQEPTHSLGHDQVLGHRFGSRPGLAHHVEQGAGEVQPLEEWSDRGRIDVLQHVQARIVISPLVRELVPAFAQERLGQRPSTEGGPADSQDHDILEGLAQSVGKAANPGHLLTRARQLQEAQLSSLAALLNVLVGDAELRLEALQTLRLDAPISEAGRQHVSEMQLEGHAQRSAGFTLRISTDRPSWAGRIPAGSCADSSA